MDSLKEGLNSNVNHRLEGPERNLEVILDQEMEIIYCEKNNCNKFIEIIYFWPSETTIIFFLEKSNVTNNCQ